LAINILEDVLVKIGVGGDHLFRFFKSLGIFNTILQKGKEINVVTEGVVEELKSILPNFKPIPAYICGFIKSAEITGKATYSGKTGRSHHTITSWKGEYNSEDLDTIKKQLEISGYIKFQGIEKFNHTIAYFI
jgi:hypothetical protein